MSNNDEQIEYWNGDAGNRWAQAQERMDRLLQPLSDGALHAAAPRSEERVIDVGCGCGTTTFAIAEQGAQVWGIDVSEPMLARARARAGNDSGVVFSLADAATQVFTPDHDLIFSRFGVMFFADPLAAFKNLHTALKPDGRLVFVCWQAPQSNDWIYVAGKAIQPHLPEPVTPPDPKAPGPFAFADSEYVGELLAGAGYRDIVIEPMATELRVADSLDDAIEFQGQIGPVARALAELDGKQREAALSAARDALAAHMTQDGLVLGSATWVVSARA